MEFALGAMVPCRDVSQGSCNFSRGGLKRNLKSLATGWLDRLEEINLCEKRFCFYLRHLPSSEPVLSREWNYRSALQTAKQFSKQTNLMHRFWKCHSDVRDC